MVNCYKKVLSILLSFALLNSSIQPLYASFPEREDEIVREAKAHSRMMMAETALQAKIKTTASFIDSWTPYFIKKAASKIGTWVESTLKELPVSYFAKSPLEIDYVRDRAYWLAHFSSAVDEIKDKGLSHDALHARLTELQDMVMQGVLSPYAYEKGLKEIEESGLGNQSIFKNTREDFKKALKRAPGFIDQTFRHEASLYIQDLQTGRGDAQEFISHIRYYRDLANALDYKETLTTIRSHLRENKKALKINKKNYEALIATLNSEIGRIAKDEKKRLQANQAFSVTASSVLPYFGQEWDEINQPTNNALAEPSKGKGIIQDPLDTSAKALRKLVYTGAKYVQEHPGQAIMMALATQVAAAAALTAFNVNSVKAPVKGGNPVNDLSERHGSASQRASFQERGIPEHPTPLLPRFIKRNVGSEFVINQNTTGIRGYPKIGGLADGNAFITWWSNQSGIFDEYGRVFFPNGTALSDEFQVSQNAISSTTAIASVVSLTNGNVFVEWDGDENEVSHIYGRLFAANGTALSNEFLVNQNTTGVQEFSSATCLLNSNIFVAWQGFLSGNWNIYGRLFAENGTALSNDIFMNQNTTGIHDIPTVTALTNGNIFATWRSDQTGSRNIYGRIFSANGTPLSNDFNINQINPSDQFLYLPAASLTDGNVFAVWTSNKTGDYDIYGRLFFPITPASK